MNGSQTHSRFPDPPACISAAILSLALLAAPVGAAAPADPALDVPARKLLAYLESIYGKKVLAGMNGERDQAGKLFAIAGKKASLLGIDLSGWNAVKYSDTYNANSRAQVALLKSWWEKDGIIPTLTWHWGNPMGTNGDFDATSKDFKPAIDMGKAVTAGTDENKNILLDLEKHADFMQPLADAGIPVLFRPLHEIDGGWFWWSDCDKPENTAALYRIIFDYFTKTRGFHNLIWIYNTGLAACGQDDPASIPLRKRFYPGAGYVDLAGIDIYPNDWWKWGDNKVDAYPAAYAIMTQVAPGKMLALNETQGAPNPDSIAKPGGPKWLYFMPWWEDRDPAAYLKSSYAHDAFITLDELPDLKGPMGMRFGATLRARERGLTLRLEGGRLVLEPAEGGTYAGKRFDLRGLILP